MRATFSISAERIASNCNWNVLFITGLFFGLICSFRKLIRSFTTSSRVIGYASSGKLVILRLAPRGEGGYKEVSEDEGPIVKLYCPSCGYRTEKPEAYIPAQALFCPKCGDGLHREGR